MSARSTTACATGWSHGSGSGAAPSRPCTATPTGSSRCPRNNCRSLRPTTWSSCRRASRRSRTTRGSCARRVRSAAVRPGARPTRWTPSSIRRGTSCAFATRGTRTGRSIPRRPATSCPSTSTSAASSTPSCICSTRGSSPVRSSTSGLAPGLEREPFKHYLAQGMIRMDGTKMSKSKGNLIAPEHYFDTVGADALRLFHLFVGPPFDDMDWSEQTEQVIDGCGRYLDRLWRTCTTAPDFVRVRRRRRTLSCARRCTAPSRRSPTTLIAGPTTPRSPTAWSCSTCSSATAVADGPAHVVVTGRSRRQRTRARRRASSRPDRPHAEVWNEALDSLLSLLAPLTPHVTRRAVGAAAPGRPSVHLQGWPEADPELVRQDTVTMVVQVNGKLRDRIEVDASISEADAEAAALASPKVKEALNGTTPKRVVSRPPRLVNIVV